MRVRLTNAVCVAGIAVALACASEPGYRLEVYLPPLRISLREVIEGRLAELGYEVTNVMPRSSSTTFSALKIRPGTDEGSLIYDWLHVTVTTSRLVTEPVSAESVRGNYVAVYAQSLAHGREQSSIPPTQGVIADAEAFVAALRTATPPVVP